ncbi:MAG TPA: glutathione S-transferase family protein [Solirubrobacterales bacterium]|nr:glutathione S-transferase family protein [Solirubrobacterales bacterium]
MIRVHRVPFSTNVERVALAAGHKGIELEWVDHPDDDRSAVIELSGQRLVPVAEFDGEVVRGSMRIVERLEAEQPDPALIPADEVGRATALITVDWFDRVWKGPPNALDGPEPPDAEALRSRSSLWTRWLVDLLGGRPYFGGEKLGIVDVCAFPFLKYAVLDPDPADGDRFHAILAELLRADDHPLLDEWVRRVETHARA